MSPSGGCKTPGLSEFKCSVNLKPQSHVDSVLGSKGRLRGGSMNPTSISWAFFFLSSSSSQGSCGNSVTYHRDTGHHTNPPPPPPPRGCTGSQGDTRQTVPTKAAWQPLARLKVSLCCALSSWGPPYVHPEMCARKLTPGLPPDPANNPKSIMGGRKEHTQQWHHQHNTGSGVKQTAAITPLLLRHFHENFKYTKRASKCPPNRFVIQV